MGGPNKWTFTLERRRILEPTEKALSLSEDRWALVADYLDAESDWTPRGHISYGAWDAIFDEEKALTPQQQEHLQSCEQCQREQVEFPRNLQKAREWTAQSHIRPDSWIRLFERGQGLAPQEQDHLQSCAECQRALVICKKNFGFENIGRPTAE